MSTDSTLAEALRLIAWSNDSAWQAQCAREALAAHEAEQEQAREAVAHVVSSGPANFPLLQWVSAEVSLNTPIGTKLYTRPQQPPLTEAQAIRLWHENAEAHRRESAFEWFAAGIIASERAHGITKDTK